ncbi:MAG: phosphoribosylamine--glycine ligase [Kiritimatiellae bacterium]|nr:phosphoribosylamine--glycine ligase [Kiritimatiellia bacterium]
MKVLVIGGGGREDALCWKIASDSTRPEVYCAPGNAGTARHARPVPVAAEDVAGLCAWARREHPDLVVVGPEAPLCAGIADRLAGEGIRVFGPCQAAARLEGSKVFAKEILRAAGVPTARAERFRSVDDALAYIRREDAPLVVKADGLAAGKGVTVCATAAQAEAAVREAMVDRAFADAGAEVLIEECLVGEEASVLALVDGEHIVPLTSAQDHKRIGDGDTGPNTGGMGAYSPAPVAPDAQLDELRRTVFEPVVAELRNRGIRYQGVLYAGLMMTAQGPKVLEFNCRFGDPETQAILPRWDGDLLPALIACADGTLTPSLVRWKPDASLCVVLAAGGYPGAYRKGDVIAGLADAQALPEVRIFHAGTASGADGSVHTSGGRVLGVCATGGDIAAARRRAYAAVERISFDGMQYRRDIAARAMPGTPLPERENRT